MIVSVSYVCVMHVCVVLSVIVQMHVFTSSLSLRHEGFGEPPPHHGRLAIAEPSKEPRPVAKSGSQRQHGDHGLLHLHCVCRDLGIGLVF